MQPDIDAGIHKFAKDGIKNKSLATLSLPRRASNRPIDMHENLGWA